MRQPATSGSLARDWIRHGRWRLPTASLAPSYVQANLVILDGSLADEFERFCHINPRPFPVLERLKPGSPFPLVCAQQADLRTDIPRYRFYEDGDLAGEVDDLIDAWQTSWCAFLLGCSFTFDAMLASHGIPVRHIEQECNVPMYQTTVPLVPHGAFSGSLVVSMRPIPQCDVDRAISLTKPLSLAHGGPVHVGLPEDLGIADIQTPDYGDAVQMAPGDVPLFWACGVTAQAVAKTSRIPFMATHAPGYMFITDWQIDASPSN